MEVHHDLIVIAGSPGSGKTTISELLQKELDAPLIDFGWLREFHLDPEWKKESPEEEEMAFENLLFILNNYRKHGYRNVIVNDFQEDKVKRLTELFTENHLALITLVVGDEAVLRQRISSRENGFTEVEEATAWNRRIIESPLLPRETRFDTAERNPQETVASILDVLQTRGKA